MEGGRLAIEVVLVIVFVIVIVIVIVFVIALVSSRANRHASLPDPTPSVCCLRPHSGSVAASEVSAASISSSSSLSSKVALGFTYKASKSDGRWRASSIKGGWAQQSGLHPPSIHLQTRSWEAATCVFAM